MIRTLVFDCFGVFYPDPVFAYAGRPGASRAVVDELTLLEDQASRGNLSKSAFITRVSKLLGEPANVVEAQFFRADQRNEAVVHFIHDLRRSGIKTGLLSNVGGDVVGDFFSPADFQDLFDAVVISAEVGMVKPDPRIFQLVCQRLNALPAEAVMVDDILENVQAAKNVGMTGIRYLDYAQFREAVDPLLQFTDTENTF